MAIPSLILGIALAVFTMIGIFGNSLVFTVVCWNKSIKKPLNLFLLNLAIADFGMECTCIPFAIAVFATKNKSITETFCYVNAYLVTLFAITGVLLILSLTIFQYLMITAPLDRSVSGIKCCTFVTVSWISAIAVASGPLLGWGQYQFSSSVFNCQYYPSGKIEKLTYNIALMIFGYTFPLMLMIFCYISILKTLRDHDVRMSKSAVIASSVRGPEETPQRKLVTTILFIFLAFVAFRTPFFIDMLVQTVFTKYWHPFLGQVSFWSIYVHAAMDPFIYALRHGEYKSTISELFVFIKRTCSLICCTKVQEGHPMKPVLEK